MQLQAGTDLALAPEPRLIGMTTNTGTLPLSPQQQGGWCRSSHAALLALGPHGRMAWSDLGPPGLAQRGAESFGGSLRPEPSALTLDAGVGAMAALCMGRKNRC